MEKILFSIGHSQHELSFFLQLLQNNDVNYVLDVRSTPYSQFASSYNRENIKSFLINHGITYAYMGEYFGARPQDEKLYQPNGYLNFEEVAKSEKFKRAFESVEKGVAQGNRIAFMCTEKDPIECHRSILVTRAFFEAGYNIQHIMQNNSIQSQSDLENRLLDMHFPNRNQLSLFSENNLSTREYICEAYKKQNQIIGCRIDDLKMVVG